jgi:hypothetical protein
MIIDLYGEFGVEVVDDAIAETVGQMTDGQLAQHGLTYAEACKALAETIQHAANFPIEDIESFSPAYAGMIRSSQQFLAKRATRRPAADLEAVFGISTRNPE